ncbi:MAG: metallophosphoesterase family protein [Bacteroidota bacterium]
MAIYAIGDIHGSLAALKTLFKQGNIQEGDKVIFLGDYVDKGPDSKGVLDWLIDRRDTYDFTFLLGNHEIMMQAARKTRTHLWRWVRSGGGATLDAYGIGDDPDWVGKIDQAHWDFIDACLPFLELGEYVFVHAGLKPGKPLTDQVPHHLFWKKYETPERYAPAKTVICGHTPRKNGHIADFGHTICIDTYAYGGQWLSCLNVETQTYLQANEKAQFRRGQLVRK